MHPYSVHRANPFHKLPSRYDWKDLKDLVRPKASHSIWTDVAINFRDQPCYRKGCVKLKLAKEAAAAYSKLSSRPQDCLNSHT